MLKNRKFIKNSQFLHGFENPNSSGLRTRLHGIVRFDNFLKVVKSVRISFFLTTLFTFHSTLLTAQDFSFKYQNLPLSTDKLLINAFAGGINAPQFATINRNNDETDDLVVFDRTNNKLSTFLAIKQPNGQFYWQYTPQYEILFPDIQNWIILIDYDQDGKKDLFTYAPAGMKVFKNVSGTQLAFQESLNPVYSVGFSGKINLFISSTDIPAIVDEDGDGDIDVLTFDFSGNFVEFHQNQSVEKYGNAKQLEFKKIGSCWGGFFKEHCKDFSFGTDCGVPLEVQRENPSGRVLHSGNTLTLLDLNGDGKKDILFGHVSCQNTAALMNEGSLKRATFNNAEYDFPKKKPINFPIFQATYFEDIDFDGKKDLIAAPNNYDNASNTIDFQNSAWLYKNIGTSQKPDFQFQQTDFLQNTMLDVGENAAPILVDLDGDGDADLLIGTGGTRSDANGYRASIWYFENVGTPETANFILRTKDYLDLSKKYQLINIQPFISDMNGDGVADFGFSASSLKSNNLEIRYLANKSARGLAFQIALEQIVEFPILDSFYRGDSPVFYDIDRDGKIDVLIASTSGNLAYFRNAGTNLAPQYHLETQNYGGVQADFLSMGVNANIADLNADGKPELLVATRTGFLKVYKNFLEQNVSKFVADSNLIFNELQSKNLALKIGGNPLLALADLNNDRLPDLILGSNTGGLRYLQNTSKLAVQTPTELEKISVFPNPSNGFVYVIVPYTADGELMNVLGQRISQKTFIANKELPIDLSGLPEGTYYLKITSLEKAPRTVKIFLKNGF